MYTCTARNPAGEVSCKAELAVRSGAHARGGGQSAYSQGRRCEPWARSHSPDPSPLHHPSLPAPAPHPRLTFLLLFCLLHPPCLALSLPSSLCCLPHLTPVQTAMEVEGAGEAEEQRGRRLSDFYDIHQEIGRCGARRGRGAWEPKGAWFLGSQAMECWGGGCAVSPSPPRVIAQGCLLLPAARGGAKLRPGVCGQVHPQPGQAKGISMAGGPAAGPAPA